MVIVFATKGMPILPGASGLPMQAE